MRSSRIDLDHCTLPLVHRCRFKTCLRLDQLAQLPTVSAVSDCPKSTFAGVGPGADTVDIIPVHPNQSLTEPQDHLLHLPRPGLYMLFLRRPGHHTGRQGPGPPWMLVLRDLQENGTRSLFQLRAKGRFCIGPMHRLLGRRRTTRCRKLLICFVPPLKRLAAAASSSNQPAAPGSASVVDLQKTMAPKTPPKNPVAKGPPRSAPAIPLSSVDDEQMFQATHRSSYEQSHAGPKATTLWITMKKD